MVSLFDSLEVLPEDPILGLAPLYKNDQRKEKVNLGIGTYKDEQGASVVFSAVKEAEKELLGKKLDKEYQPIDGDLRFKEAIASVLFGEHAPAVKDTAAIIETLGGSGAIRLAGDLLMRSGIETVSIPDPSWSNHFGLLKNIKNLPAYPYYDTRDNTLSFDLMLKALKNLPDKSAVLFHASCHNPTGEDLSLEQWEELEALTGQKNLLPLFDFAYHGYKAGIGEDLKPLLHFFKKGREFLICYSLSKSLSLYGERVGALVAVTSSRDAKKKVLSQVKNLIRQAYSSPPLHGARLAETVFLSKELRSSWENELATVRQRILSMRTAFAAKWEALFEERCFDHVKRQHGLFSLTGLTKIQVLALREEFAIYMPDNGRINFAGLNEGNLDYTLNSIAHVKRASRK
ncbi:aromatic amino acid transaminase [Estrella lausannensis]|uniref:Aminotransferase n=1 Tax=Estrella lausannensis TaxID=483423 RepID=A0A0H5DNR9_9BACT|nr:aromatic amino acid transaminase [Estrella lausannensis]CRX37463.1 Aspartate aminotransferase [Estrella lausannensis]